MSLTDLRFYLVIGALALLSWGVVLLFDRQEIEEARFVEGGAEYFSLGYQKTEMDQTGQPKNFLIATKMYHLDADGTTHLEHPVMTLYNNVKPWVIQSDTGVLFANGDDLFLAGAVKITRDAAPRVKPLVINTTDLKVSLPNNYAETAQWAELISAPSRTEGVGMQVTFIEPVHLKLLANVKGRYVLR